MGGKNKQRTKGHVRPSSSGRAAEVLTRQQGSIPGFVGFSSSLSSSSSSLSSSSSSLSSSSELSYVPALHGADDIDCLVDAEFRLVLRKLSKRDTVTRLKAVQDFGSMCQQRDAEDVKGVLPYWPRIYCKIAVDPDRRIREATHVAQEQLVLKVRRSLAPFLKSLMGHWILAQCDSHAPAAAAARRAFQAAFSPAKQPEALGFCKEEILSVLHDVLLKETAETLSDPNSVTEEEREAKFLRLLSGSLLGVKRLLGLLPPEDRDALEDRLAQLVSANKFWKYSKHKAPQVRGAFFELAVSLCSFCPSLVRSEAARLSAAVLLSIDDVEPLVLAPVWEALLHVVSSLPDCWLHVNVTKAFLPKLFSLLRGGGGGLARALHPNLMPLLSKLPPQVTAPPHLFYCSFFTSLTQGLSAERAASSPSESAVIVASFVECLRFCVLQNTNEEEREEEEKEEQRRTRVMLVSQQLLPLLEAALSSPALQRGPLFLLVTDMLASWERRAGLHGDGEADGSRDAFQNLLVHFWGDLNLVLVRHVDREDAEPRLLEGIATLLQVMCDPERGNRKLVQNRKSVRLCLPDGEAADGEDEDGGVEPQRDSLAGGDKAAVASLRSDLFEAAVCGLARICLIHVSRTNSEPHLHFLSRLLQSFHTPRVFRTLVELDAGVQDPVQVDPVREDPVREDPVRVDPVRVDPVRVDPVRVDPVREDPVQEDPVRVDPVRVDPVREDPALRFLDRLVLPWLSRRSCGGGAVDSVTPLVEMLFSSLRCCSRHDATRVLDHVTTMDHQCDVILLIIQRACSDPEALRSCSDWLKGSVLGGRLLGLAEDLCRVGVAKSTGPAPTNRDNWTLISLVLSQHTNNDPLIGEVYLEGILEKLHATLSETKTLLDGGDAEPLVSFICDVASSFFSSVRDCLRLASAEELLLAVFQLTAQDRSPLSASLVSRLQSVCVSGVSSLVRHGEETLRDGGFLHGAACWVLKTLLTSNLDLHGLQVLVLAVQNLVETLSSSSPPSSSLLLHFFRLLTPSDAQWTEIRRALPPQWTSSPLLSSRLRVCDDSSLEVCRLKDLKLLPLHLSVSALLAKLLMNTDSPTDPALLKNTASELLYVLRWCEEVKFSLISSFRLLLADWGLAEGLKGRVSTADLLGALYSRSLADGGLWSLTLGEFIRCNQLSVAAATLYGGADSFFPPSPSQLTTLQVISPSVSKQERRALATLATAGLMDWEKNADVCGCLSVLMCCLEADAHQKGAELQADAPQDGAELQADAPQKGVELQADAPQKGVELQADAPLEGAELQAGAPLEGVELQADAPQKGAELQAGAPLERVDLQVDAPLEEAELQADAPQKGAELQAGAPLERVDLQVDAPLEEAELQAVLATLMEWRSSREEWFLFSSDLSLSPASSLALCVEMMRFLSWLLRRRPALMGGAQWDFLLCSTLAWMESVSESVGGLWRPWLQVFACCGVSLTVDLSVFFSSPPPSVLHTLPEHLTEEWSDFFLGGVANLLLPLPAAITDSFPEPDDPVFPAAVVQRVAVALALVPVQQLTENSLPARLVADQRSRLPEPLQTLLNTFCPLLLFKARTLQTATYLLLDRVMPLLPECDGEGDASKSEDDGDEPCLSPPAALMAVLSTCEELCDSVLAAVQVGEVAVVPPLSVEHCCIMGYLLAWKLLLTFFKSSPSHLRAHYSQYLKRSGSLSQLLLLLFKLMPENPVYQGPGSGSGSETRTFFTESLRLAVDDSDVSPVSELRHLACSVYFGAVQDLPAMVRLWWNGQEKRVSAAADRFTARYVSPVLAAQEIAAVHASTQMFQNMTVKARSAAREVIATYSVDDIFIELLIQLPQNHPLGSVSVESGRRVGVANQQWRNWMLQLSTYLTHQNGSIMEGLALWKNNVDKRFEGIEDCMICFSVIHGSNYSLPKKACRTCRKKFHSACLYKWFTSSNKSTCPLCRETFF